MTLCCMCGLFTEAVARIQDIIDGKNLRRDYSASGLQFRGIGGTAPVSSVGGISTSVSFAFHLTILDL